MSKEILKRKLDKSKQIRKELKRKEELGLNKEKDEEMSSLIKERDKLISSVETGDVEILAGDDDIPVCAVKPLILYFAKELHTTS